MSSKIFTALAISSLSLSGCFNTPISSIGSVNSSLQSNKYAAEGTTDIKSVSTVDSNSTENIQLAAPSIEGMSGAGVTIAPGTLGISVNLVVEQAADINDTTMMAEMGLAEDVQISSATPGMIIRPSENVDLKKPLSISMPLPVGLSFHLNTGSKYAVLYKYFDPGEQKLVSGIKIVDGTAVKLSFDEASGKDVMVFDGYFGAYWAVILNREIVAAEVPPQKIAEQPIMNKANVPVISSTGVVTETEIVKTQAIAEIIWAKTSAKFVAEPRSLVLQATVPTGATVKDCKADIFENTVARSGIVVDATITELQIPVKNMFAHSIVGRFRCLDSLGRITVTPWSDVVSIPAGIMQEGAPNLSPGVDLTTAGIVSLSGVLKPVKSLLLVKHSRGHSGPNFREVPVNADGYFKVFIDRSNVIPERVKAKLNASPIIRDDEFFNDLVYLFNVSRAEAEDHTSTFDTEPSKRDEMIAELDALIANGESYSLVTYDKSLSNKHLQAGSFRFIGLPAPNGSKLLQFHGKSLKGHLRLGTLDTTAETGGISILTAVAALSDSADIQNNLAAFSGTLRGIRNAFANPGYRANTSFTWRTTGMLTSYESTYSPVADTIYKGYRIHLEKDANVGIYSFETICASGHLPLELVPPMTVSSGYSIPPDTYAAFNNVGAYATGDTTPGKRECEAPLFRAQEDEGRLRTEFPHQTTILGPIPTGAWIHKFNGGEQARFHFDHFQPVDAASAAKVFVPSIKLTDDGTNYTQVSIQFYRYSNGTPTVLTDLSFVRKVISDARVSFWGSSSDVDADITFAANSNVATATFLVPNTTMNASIEYTLGDQTYRFEFSY